MKMLGVQRKSWLMSMSLDVYQKVSVIIVNIRYLTSLLGTPAELLANAGISTANDMAATQCI